MKIGTLTTQQVLRECQVFSTLANAELEKIAGLALEKEYEVGATLFQEGDSTEELFVLQEGKVVLQMSLSKTEAQMGRRITIDVVTKNEVVGWSAIIEPHVYTLTAVCLQKVKALSISGAKLRWLLRDNHNIGFEVLKGLIKVVASRLDDTRQVLVSERLLPVVPSGLIRMKRGIKIQKLSELVPGMGERWANPANLPAGPIYLVHDEEGEELVPHEH